MQCVAGETLILDPTTGVETPIRDLAEAGQPITVLTMFGPRTIAAPFLKGVDRLYRVADDKGQSFVATAKHSFLTAAGWTLVEQIPNAKYVRTDNFYDLTVPGADHYWAQGFWHHNSGKSLTCLVIPLLYFLFELQETCILAAPSKDICHDKWQKDIEPIISRSRYASLLPKRGPGSKSGSKPNSIKFGNGVFLKFMSGKGDDKSRSEYTSRYVFITETDGMDTASKTSRESNPIGQIEQRMKSFDATGLIIMECTVSTEDGRTWSDYTTRSTNSRILKPCPHCSEYVNLERECLMGWHDAKDEIEAAERSEWFCPKCGQIISQEDRIAMNAKSVLVHKGQEIDKAGVITGDAPRTKGLGFRWTASDNQLRTAPTIGAEEWAAVHGPRPDDAELELRQFTWCIPAAASVEEEVELNVDLICNRLLAGVRRGIVPAGYSTLTAAIDVGKSRCHWVAIAWAPGATAHVVDYNVFDVESKTYAVEDAIFRALMKASEEIFDIGWRDTADAPVLPKLVWIDAGYKSDAIYRFIREKAKPMYQAMKGFGATAGLCGMYNESKQWNGLYVGRGYQPGQDFNGWAVDADQWKSFFHARITAPKDQPSAMTLFDTDPSKHRDFAKHICSEHSYTKFVPGKGLVTRWEQDARENHKLDVCYSASAAAHFAGVRLLGEMAQAQPSRRRIMSEPTKRRDGRSWMDR